MIASPFGCPQRSTERAMLSCYLTRFPFFDPIFCHALIPPGVNISSSHVVRCNVRAPNEIGICQDDHRLARLGLRGLVQHAKKELITFYAPQTVKRGFIRICEIRRCPRAIGPVKVAVTGRSPFTNDTFTQRSRVNVEWHWVLDDLRVNRLHLVRVGAGKTLAQPNQCCNVTNTVSLARMLKRVEVLPQLDQLLRFIT